MALSRFTLLLIVLLAVPRAAFADEVKLVVPVLIGQTGAAATFGKSETDAYTLAAEEWNSRGGVNGAKVELLIEDTQTNAQQLVTAFQRMARHRPPAILGPTWLDGFPAVIPQARAKNIALVTPSAAREAFQGVDREWPISFYYNSTLEIRALMDALKKRGHKRVGLVYEQEPFAEMIRRLVLDTGIELAADFGVQAGETAYQPLLMKARAQPLDVLVIFVWDERSLLTLLQQLRIHAPALNLATVHDGEGWLSNTVFQPAIDHLLYTKFVIADTSFGQRFKSRFGYEPMLTASNAYDALNAVLSAHAAGKKDGKEVRDHILGSELRTATFGLFRFGEDGSVPSKIEIREFKAGSQ